MAKTHAQTFIDTLAGNPEVVPVKLHADDLEQGYIVKINPTTGVSSAPSDNDKSGLFGVLLESGDTDDIVPCQLKGICKVMTGDTSAVNDYVEPMADYMVNAVNADLIDEREEVSLGTPILADNDRIVTSEDWADGDLTIAAQPDVPRNITITVTDADDSITGGTLTVTGISPQGNEITEVLDISEGKTLVGTKIFSNIQSAVIADTTGTPATGTDVVVIGVGSKIGLPKPIDSSSDVAYTIFNDSVDETATITTGTDTSSVTTSGTLDGSKELVVIYNPLNVGIEYGLLKLLETGVDGSLKRAMFVLQ